MNQSTVDAVKFYRRTGEFAVRSSAGETILMPVRSHGTGPDNILILNPTGSLIWQTLGTPSRLDAVVAAVVEEFEVGQEEAQADVEAFVEILSKAGLVQEA